MRKKVHRLWSIKLKYCWIHETFLQYIESLNLFQLPIQEKIPSPHRWVNAVNPEHFSNKPAPVRNRIDNGLRDYVAKRNHKRTLSPQWWWCWWRWLQIVTEGWQIGVSYYRSAYRTYKMVPGPLVAWWSCGDEVRFPAIHDTVPCAGVWSSHWNGFQLTFALPKATWCHGDGALCENYFSLSRFRSVTTVGWNGWNK